MSAPRESLWLGNLNKSDGKRKREGKEEKESTEEKKDPGRIPVFVRSLSGRTHTLLLSPHDDVSTLLCLVEDQIHIPQHLWYVRTNGRPLPGPTLPHGLSRDDVLTVHAGLAGGAHPHVQGEWYCNVCQRGGCWPARASCFRCGCPRKESEAMHSPHVVPPRERQFLGRAPVQARSTGCPTERRPSPQGARKNNAVANDKGATARIVLEALANLDLDPEVLKRIRLQLDPPPPAPEPSKRLADLEVEIDKAQHDAARLQAVVVKKQTELRQAEERSANKAKELMELHAEMLKVKMEVTQVVPLLPLLRCRPLSRWKRKRW